MSSTTSSPPRGSPSRRSKPPTPGMSCWPSWRGPAPVLATARTDRLTYGGAVAALAQALGKPMMPWQSYVADVALEVDEDGRFAYQLVIVTVPRQSGKT